MQAEAAAEASAAQDAAEGEQRQEGAGPGAKAKKQRQKGGMLTLTEVREPLAGAACMHHAASRAHAGSSAHACNTRTPMLTHAPTHPSPGITSATQIATDKLTKIAAANWSHAARTAAEPPAFSPDLVRSIYQDELMGASGPSLGRVMVLEISQYLESYLWPHFDPASATFEHVMSILLMVNKKFRENVPAWACFHARKVCKHGWGEGWPGEGEGQQQWRRHSRGGAQAGYALLGVLLCTYDVPAWRAAERGCFCSKHRA